MERKLHALIDCGIRHIINLMEAHEIDREGRPFVEYQAEFERQAAQRGYVVAVERQPIRDMDVPDFGHMRRILDGIDAALAADRLVYVHCWGGKGRTGTVVGCYLMRHRMAEARTVLSRIRDLRRPEERAQEHSPETNAQRRMVMAWPAGE